jgi:HlyD family secretion protein
MLDVQTGQDDLNRLIALSLGALGLCLISLLLWAFKAELAGAVIANGTVVVETLRKSVQHADGGIVASIAVEDGDEVQEGALLIRLDDTSTRTNLAVVNAQIDTLLTRLIRLQAERDNKRTLTWSASLVNRANEEAMAVALASEEALFTSRATTLAGRKGLVRERIEQSRESIKGLEIQLDSTAKQLELIELELNGVNDLYDKGMMPLPRVVALRRTATELRGQSGKLMSEVAQTKGSIAELEQQIIQYDEEWKTAILSEIRDAEAKLAEMSEKKVAAEDKLKRIDIRAPRSGFVHELSVHTVGGVVKPGETIMTIIPRDDSDVVDAQVPPNFIDQVWTDQTALVRFPTFDRRTTPELQGKVVRVAYDTTRDQRTGENFFPVRIQFAPEEVERLQGLKLVPGMPAEVQLRTRERTVISYLLKPLSDQISRTFRER